MNLSSQHLSPEFLFQQNLSFLQELFPGKLAVTNEEFAAVLGKSPFIASRDRKAGQSPVTMDQGKQRAGNVLLTEAARWLLSFMQIPREPQNTGQPQNPAPASTPPIDIPIQVSAPDFPDIPAPQPPARTGKRGRPQGSRNKTAENLIGNTSHFDM